METADQNNTKENSDNAKILTPQLNIMTEEELEA